MYTNDFKAWCMEVYQYEVKDETVPDEIDLVGRMVELYETESEKLASRSAPDYSKPPYYNPNTVVGRTDTKIDHPNNGAPITVSNTAKKEFKEILGDKAILITKILQSLADLEEVDSFNIEVVLYDKEDSSKVLECVKLSMSSWTTRGSMVLRFRIKPTTGVNKDVSCMLDSPTIHNDLINSLGFILEKELNK